MVFVFLVLIEELLVVCLLHPDSNATGNVLT